MIKIHRISASNNCASFPRPNYAAFTTCRELVITSCTFLIQINCGHFQWCDLLIVNFHACSQLKEEKNPTCEHHFPHVPNAVQYSQVLKWWSPWTRYVLNAALLLHNLWLLEIWTKYYIPIYTSLYIAHPPSLQEIFQCSVWELIETVTLVL